MPTVLLAGAFGQHNPGDEALLSAFLKTLDDWTPVATSRDPEDTRGRHGCEAVPSSSLPAMTAAALRADAVVFAGGTVFKELHPTTGRHPSALLASGACLAATARTRGARVALVGVGASPLRRDSSRTLARVLADSTDMLVLRDEESGRCLEDAGIPPPYWVAADVAWTLTPTAPRPRQRTGTLVALSHLAGVGDSLVTWLAGALWELADRGPVAIQPWQVRADGADDHALAQRLREVLGSTIEVLPPPTSLEHAVETMATAETAVTLRYHGLVAAAAAGTPAVGVAHEPKLAGLARRLGQRTVAPDMPPTVLAVAADAAREDGPPQRHLLERERARADDALRLLQITLSGGRALESPDLDTLELSPAPWQA